MKTASSRMFRNTLRTNFLAPIHLARILLRYSITQQRDNLFTHVGISLIGWVFVQTLLSGLSVPVTSEVQPSSAMAESAERVYAHQLVRTDCRTQKMDAFLQPKEKQPPDSEPARPSHAEAAAETTESNRADVGEMDDFDMLEAIAEHEGQMATAVQDSSAQR